MRPNQEIEQRFTAHQKTPDIPPTYRIDLSLPPRQRYVSLVTDYIEEVTALTGLFDDLVQLLHPSASVKWVKRLARLLLTRLYTKEETEEIRGISEAVKVEFYLLVALNVLLDLLMGCTSGAARSKDTADQTKMLHFRTLDWGMDPLRKVVVQIEYVRSQSGTPDKVLATSVTYAGFVGVLTGVRKNLSMSLNFRPQHNDAGSRVANLRFYSHHLLVLLGLRRSISSLLREHLLPKDNTIESASLTSLSMTLPRVATTACYLTFSDGVSALTMEKDHHSAVLRSSETFIVITNHDLDGTVEPPDGNQDHIYNVNRDRMTLDEAIGESVDRRGCMVKHWERKVTKELRRINDPGSQAGRSEKTGLNYTMETRASRRRRKEELPNAGIASSSSASTVIDPVDAEVTTTEEELVRWMTSWPTTNETTHYGCIMDATLGKVAWIRRYLEPVEPPD